MAGEDIQAIFDRYETLGEKQALKKEHSNIIKRTIMLNNWGAWLNIVDERFKAYQYEQDIMKKKSWELE